MRPNKPKFYLCFLTKLFFSKEEEFLPSLFSNLI
jgi:hypothetical protein